MSGFAGDSFALDLCACAWVYGHTPQLRHATFQCCYLVIPPAANRLLGSYGRSRPNITNSLESSSDDDSSTSPAPSHDAILSAQYHARPECALNGEKVAPAALGRAIQFGGDKTGCYGAIQGLWVVFTAYTLLQRRWIHAPCSQLVATTTATVGSVPPGI